MDLKKAERLEELEKKIRLNNSTIRHHELHIDIAGREGEELRKEYNNLEEELSTQCTTDNCENPQQEGDDLCSSCLEESMSEQERKDDRKPRSSRTL